MLTCYDATTAAWLWRGGVRTLLVGDTAAQVILGHDSTLPAGMDFMVTITAAVRRGAPQALVVADMPFGSYQSSDAQAMDNAARFLKEAGADAVKLEVDQSHASLVERLAHAGVPVMAHIGSRPQQVRAAGGYRSAGKRPGEASALVETARLMVESGAVSVLVEAVPGQVGERIVGAAVGSDGQPVPVIGCGAGPGCHGHVVVLQDLLRLTDWQPPFVVPTGDIGRMIKAAASQWVALVQSGQYLSEGGPYRMTEQ
jgi:3-methyl-2-oxobutanoate hydroxymethyltransferase